MLLFVEYFCTHDGRGLYEVFYAHAVVGEYEFPCPSNNLTSLAFWLGADAEEM